MEKLRSTNYEELGINYLMNSFRPDTPDTNTRRFKINDNFKNWF